MSLSVYDFAAIDIDGRERRLDEFRGQALLIVNVASRCTFTSQYEGLEMLWRRYRHRGFAVLGFPCDQFAHQEPDDEAGIRAFCSRNYDVSFPLFAKIDVNGDNAHPLFRWLRQSCPGLLGSTAIKWNFTKFLLGRSGHAVRRFAPLDSPQRIEPHVQALLDSTGQDRSPPP